MLSETHTTSHITHWFNEFIRLYKDIPNVFISDMSSVLLVGAAKSFAGCADLTDYIDWLFNTLCNPGNASRNISCYIRIDVAHLVKNVTTCDALKKKPSEEREFFIRSTCLLVKCSSIAHAERVLRSILIVAKSGTKGESYSVHKKYLDELISNDEPIIEANSVSIDFQTETGGILEDENISSSSSVKAWLTEIDRSTTGEALENADAAEENELRNASFVKFLLRLSDMLVLWTGVAATYFDAPLTASSTHVENYFMHLKHDLNSVIPGRADEVVAAHIDLIDGMIVDASQKYIEFIDAAGGVEVLLSDQTELLSDYKNCDLASTNGSDSDSEDDKRTDENVPNDDKQTNENEANKAAHEVGENALKSNQKNTSSCIACKRGDMPTGAHRCMTCKTAVHIFDGCSISCGDEEGYGQRRICISCAAKARTTDAGTSIAKQLNEEEKWQRKSKSSRSYLNPVQNWNIDRRVQSKPKISMLKNASLSTTVHTVQKKKVALRNTCAADSLFQVN